MRHIKAFIFSLITLSCVFAPATVIQANGGGGGPTGSATQKIFNNLGKAASGFGAPASGRASTTPGQVIGEIIKVALGFVGTITFIIFLYGGFLWLSARGNDDQVKTAKKYLTNGVIGTIIAILAYSLTFYITDIVFQATA